MANAPHFVEGQLNLYKVVLFCKSYSPECKVVKGILKECSPLNEENFCAINIEKRTDCSEVETYLWKLSGKNNREVPLMFVNKNIFGGYLDIMRLFQNDTLVKALETAMKDGEHVQSEDVDIVIKLTDRLQTRVGIDTMAETDFDPLVHIFSSKTSFKDDLVELAQQPPLHVRYKAHSITAVKLNYFRDRMAVLELVDLRERP